MPRRCGNCGTASVLRAYTTYFKEFQQYFAGRNLRYIRPEEINAYIVHLIDTRGISSCQQNLRINSIKFYFEKVLGLERKCYEVKRAKRERTLPDVLSKEEINPSLTQPVRTSGCSACSRCSTPPG